MFQLSWSDLPVLVQIKQVKGFEEVLLCEHLADIGAGSDEL
jgi:hypothetical protein